MGMDFLRSFRYAFRGLRTAFVGERNARINMVAAVAAHPDHSERVGAIKDMSAAAVLVTALGALGVACLLFLPRLVHIWR